MTSVEILEIFLLGFIVFLEVLHYKERHDLYNRLMARNLHEYSTHKIEEVKAQLPPEKEQEFIRI